MLCCCITPPCSASHLHTRSEWLDLQILLQTLNRPLRVWSSIDEIPCSLPVYVVYDVTLTVDTVDSPLACQVLAALIVLYEEEHSLDA